MIKALDISAHQSTFDAAKAKAAGIGLVVCRAAYGTAKDTRWDRFTGDVRAAGLPLAAYGFLTAHYKSLNKGSLDAARPYMHKQIDGWIAQAKAAGARWLAVDEEAENAANGKVLGLSRADNTTLLIEACDRIEAAGLVPRLYCGAAWAMSNIDRARFNRKYWIAYYYRDPNDPDFLDGALPAGKYGDFMRGLGGDLAGWQFGRIGLGPKYGAGSANLDRNYFYDMEDDKMDYSKYSDTVLIGPASSGDQRAMCNLINSIGGIYCGLEVRDEDTYICAGPMSDGDKNKVLRRADELALGIQDYVPKDGPAEPAPEPTPVPGVSVTEAVKRLRAALDGLPAEKAETILAKIKLDECEMWATRAAQE